jgi:HAD superfamily hydrolase (TIGR01509 family)
MTMTTTRRCIILDVDGTLVDSNDAHAQAWIEAFREHGVAVEYRDVRRCIGMGGDKLMPAVSGLDEASPEGQAIGSRRAKIFKEHFLPSLQPFPGVRDLLARLKNDGFGLVVASSAKQDELGPLLQIALVNDLVEHATSSDDADESKPDPDIVEAALNTVQCCREHATMLGDTPYDVEAAGRAGVRTVCVRSGGWDLPELDGAALIYDDAADILAHYEDLRRLALDESRFDARR